MKSRLLTSTEQQILANSHIAASMEAMADLVAQSRTEARISVLTQINNGNAPVEPFETLANKTKDAITQRWVTEGMHKSITAHQLAVIRKFEGMENAGTDKTKVLAYMYTLGLDTIEATILAELDTAKPEQALEQANKIAKEAFKIMSEATDSFNLAVQRLENSSIEDMLTGKLEVIKQPEMDMIFIPVENKGIESAKRFAMRIFMQALTGNEQVQASKKAHEKVWGADPKTDRVFIGTTLEKWNELKDELTEILES